ncbi:MAG: sigma-70 family RNA polymerase sigma factor [Opitutaceae bacterium]|nr:sigma-70 family RNA polymerase sigma factor [Opitutaceae bacterium]
MGCADSVGGAGGAGGTGSVGDAGSAGCAGGEGCVGGEKSLFGFAAARDYTGKRDHSMSTDAELLGAYAGNRSETAFAELVERRIGFVYGTALRQTGGDAHAAQDVTQAVFSLVAKKAAMLAHHESLSGWLYTTATHIARRSWRDAQSRRKREQEAAIMNEIEKDGAARVAHATHDVHGDAAHGAPDDADRLRPLLDEALGALREGEREAVLLRFFEGRGFAEIGAALKMSEDAARMRVARAVEKMRGLFAKRGVTSSAAAMGTLMTAEAAQGAPAGLAASVSAGAVTSAGAITATSGAGAFLVFMCSAKITMLTVLVLCIAGGTAYYGARRQRAAEENLAAAKAENARLLGQLAVAGRKTEFLEGHATPAMRSTPENASTAIMAGRKLLAEHPEVRAKLDAAGRAGSFASSFWVAREMGLSADQSDALAEICAEGIRSSNRDIPGYGSVTLESRNSGDAARREAKIREFLGGDGLAKYKELSDRYSAVSRYSRSLASALHFTDTPLTSAQAQALAQVCLDMKKGRANHVDMETWWAEVVGQAGAFLSEKQIVVLGTMAEQYQSDYVKWQRIDAVADERAKNKSR